MKIYVKQATGITFELDVDVSNTIEDVRSYIRDAKGIPPERQELLYGGKHLEDGRTLSDYNVWSEATLALIVRPSPEPDRIKDAVLFPQEVVPQNIEAWRQLAKEGSYDEDIEIVDPEMYNRHLEILADQVLQASEVRRCQGIYDLRDQNIWAPDSGVSRNMFPEVPDWMWTTYGSIYIRLSPDSSTKAYLLASLWKTLLVLLRVITGCRTLQAANFCQASFSLLFKHEAFDVAEIVRIPISDVESIQKGIIDCLSSIHYRNELMSMDDIRDMLWAQVLTPCHLLLTRMYWPMKYRIPSIELILSAARMTAILLDLALVSYTGSHGYRFDTKCLKTNFRTFNVDSDIDWLSLRCSLRRLACLREFLEGRQVWVFEFPSKDQATATNDNRPLGILTTMNDFADIWGPVYAIPEPKGSGMVRRYNVSKGIICRAGGKEPGLRNAVKCHWYNKPSWLRGLALKYLPLSESSYLSPDDLLLISGRGDLMVEKENCRYTLDAYEEDYGMDLNELGTRDSAWRWENRGISMGFSRIVGVTVSGTQKRIPETTLKETILNKWLLNPERRNPHVLNQYLGVEVSHCSGNARRIPVRKILTLSPMVHTLESHFPNWRSKPWGGAFWAAVSSNNGRDIESVWRRFEQDREHIGRLVAFALDILGPTGLETSRFSAAFLHGGQEASINLTIQMNTWAEILKDTPSTACFSIINECCLLCNVPDHSSATCSVSSGQEMARTTLQTRFALNFGCWDLVKLRSLDKHLRRHDVGSFVVDDVLRVDSKWVPSFILPPFFQLNQDILAEGIEERNPTSLWGHKTSVYIQASEVSHGGMAVARTRPRESCVPVGPCLDESTAVSLSDGTPLFSAPETSGESSSGLHLSLASVEQVNREPQNTSERDEHTRAGKTARHRPQVSPSAAKSDSGRIRDGKQPPDQQDKIEFDMTAMRAVLVPEEEVVRRSKGRRVKDGIRRFFEKSNRAQEG
ncbi:hypothetical protein V8F20_003979 [Naviculisporaceae sp. PSN 640]